MEITIVINDETIQKVTKDEVARAINAVIHEKVKEIISTRYVGPITFAIHTYLEKKLTQEDIQKLIDAKVREAIDERTDY